MNSRSANPPTFLALSRWLTAGTERELSYVITKWLHNRTKPPGSKKYGNMPPVSKNYGNMPKQGEY